MCSAYLFDVFKISMTRVQQCYDVCSGYMRRVCCVQNIYDVCSAMLWRLFRIYATSLLCSEYLWRVFINVMTFVQNIRARCSATLLRVFSTTVTCGLPGLPWRWRPCPPTLNWTASHGPEQNKYSYSYNKLNIYFFISVTIQNLFGDVCQSVS